MLSFSRRALGRARATGQPSGSSTTRPCTPRTGPRDRRSLPPSAGGEAARSCGTPLPGPRAEPDRGRARRRNPSTSPTAATEKDDHGPRHRRHPPPRGRSGDQPDPDHRGDPDAAVAQGAGDERRIPARLGARHRRRRDALHASLVGPPGATTTPPSRPGRHPAAARDPGCSCSRSGNGARDRAPASRPALPKWMSAIDNDRRPSRASASASSSPPSIRRTC